MKSSELRTHYTVQDPTLRDKTRNGMEREERLLMRRERGWILGAVQFKGGFEADERGYSLERVVQAGMNPPFYCLTKYHTLKTIKN